MSSPTVSRAIPGAAAQRPSRLGGGRLRDVALLPALILLVIIGSFLSPSFLTYPNLVSILGASAALAILVLAESLIILVGKFDLSLESTCGFAPAIGAMLVLPTASQGFGTSRCSSCCAACWWA